MPALNLHGPSTHSSSLRRRGRQRACGCSGLFLLACIRSAAHRRAGPDGHGRRCRNSIWRCFDRDTPDRIGCIDPFEANFGFADRQGVAVYNPGNADRFRGMSIADEEECCEDTPDHFGRPNFRPMQSKPVPPHTANAGASTSRDGCRRVETAPLSNKAT